MKDFIGRLADRIRPIIKNLEEAIVIDPSELADEVMRQLDPDRTVQNYYPEIHFAAHSAFRQAARAALRRRYPPGTGRETEGTERERSQPLLLPDLDRLQHRYPQTHDEDDEDFGYVLREKMTEADWLWNLEQLAKDIYGRTQHYEQLKRWGMARGWNDPDISIETAP